jgi:hypothetical protein
MSFSNELPFVLIQLNNDSIGSSRPWLGAAVPDHQFWKYSLKVSQARMGYETACVQARSHVADVIGAQGKEIIFTSRAN